MKNQLMAFINIPLSGETIEGMPEMHDTAKRLYAAAKELRDVTGQSAVARLLDVSPQVMKNWEARGISEGGALKAQKQLGCDANWLLTGEPTAMRRDGWQPTAKHAVAEDTPPYLRPSGAWPFETFSPEDFMLLDPVYRRTIEDQLLGAITRIRQSKAAPSKAA